MVFYPAILRRHGRAVSASGSPSSREDVRRCWRFAQQLAQCSTFAGRHRMHAGVAALGPMDMQAARGEVDVVPAQSHHLRRSQAVAVGDQDRRRVPMPAAVLLGGLDEPLDLPFCQVFSAASANCYIFGARSRCRVFSIEIAFPPLRTVTNWRTCNRATEPCPSKTKGDDLAYRPSFALKVTSCS